MVGWTAVLTPYKAGLYANAFWLALCRDHKDVEHAHADAVRAAGGEGACGNLDQTVILGAAQRVLRPARWGH